MADEGRGVEAAGAVADDDLSPARGEQAAEGADELGMRGDGALRPAAGDEVDLEGHLHARARPVKAAEGREGLKKRRLHALVVRTADDGHIGHGIFPFSRARRTRETRNYVV